MTPQSDGRQRQDSGKWPLAAVTLEQLLTVLRERRAAIAARWQEALTRTSFVPLSGQQVRQHLLALTDQATDVLLSEPLERAPAVAIGATLARLYYGHPEALGGTLEVLTREFLADLPAAHCAALGPRLATLLNGVAAGFGAVTRDTILAEQETMRSALLAARRQAEEALQASEARFRAIYDGAAIGIGVADVTGPVLETNAAMQAMFGYSGDEMRGMVVTAQFAHPDDAATDWALYQELVAGQRTHFGIEKRFYRKDGQLVWTHLTVSLVRDAAGQPQFAIAMMEDISERKQVAAELAEVRRRLAERQENERLALAHDLHDSTVQQLLAINYQLAQSLRQAGGGRQPHTQQGEELPRAVEAARRDLLGVVAELRKMIGELRPAGLEELGLKPALAGYVARLRREGHPAMPQLVLDWAEDELMVPPLIARCLFRVAQEALRNALRHAQAQTIVLCLRQDEHTVVFQVHDDGCGFQLPTQLSELAQAGHFGLVGMAERVGWVGGEFAIESRPGEGTTLLAHIPFSREAG